MGTARIPTSNCKGWYKLMRDYALSGERLTEQQMMAAQVNAMKAIDPGERVSINWIIDRTHEEMWDAKNTVAMIENRLYGPRVSSEASGNCNGSTREPSMTDKLEWILENITMLSRDLREINQSL